MKTVKNRPNISLVKRNYKISRLVSPAPLRTSAFMSNKKNANVGKYRSCFTNF